jgi:hypothetical protein
MVNTSLTMKNIKDGEYQTPNIFGRKRRWRHVECRPGPCAIHRSHYAGGDEVVLKKLRQGICPSCGGNARKLFR